MTPTPAKTDNRPVVASDMEGTLSFGYAWEGMRDYLRDQKQGARYRRLMLRMAPGLVLYRLRLVDERAFKERWIVQLFHLFAGYDAAQMAHMADWVTENTLWPARRRPVIAELRAHLAAGRRVMLVSGLFAPMLEKLAARLPGCESLGTSVELVDGRYTGRLAGPLNVGPAKVAHLNGVVPSGRLFAAYGDTRRDIPMLEMADRPVAVHPDPVLRTHAAAAGWRILETEEPTTHR